MIETIGLIVICAIIYFFGSKISRKFDKTVDKALTKLSPEQLKEMENKAKAGDPEGLIAIGDSYHYGVNGYEKNLDKAVEMLKKAAEKGSATGMFRLAALYEQENDQEAAFEWHLKAARAGEKNEWITVALCYYEGKGTPRDVQTAAWWYNKALKVYVWKATEIFTSEDKQYDDLKDAAKKLEGTDWVPDTEKDTIFPQQ